MKFKKGELVELRMDIVFAFASKVSRLPFFYIDPETRKACKRERRISYSRHLDGDLGVVLLGIDRSIWSEIMPDDPHIYTVYWQRLGERGCVYENEIKSARECDSMRVDQAPKDTDEPS